MKEENFLRHSDRPARSSSATSSTGTEDDGAGASNDTLQGNPIFARIPVLKLILRIPKDGESEFDYNWKTDKSWHYWIEDIGNGGYDKQGRRTLVTVVMINKVVSTGGDIRV